MTVEALRRRRPETLGELLETYGRELQSVAYLILRDRAEAEDVVIETLLTAFERGGTIRDERALRAWLLRVATNQALGVRRRSVPRDAAGGRARIERRPATLGRTAPRGSPCSTASPTSRSRCGPRSCCATTPTSVSTRSPTTLGKSPNTIKAQLQTALDRLRVHLADPVGPSLGEAHHA